MGLAGVGRIWPPLPFTRSRRGALEGSVDLPPWLPETLRVLED
jgi:hypothetical protein